MGKQDKAEHAGAKPLLSDTVASPPSSLAQSADAAVTEAKLRETSEQLPNAQIPCEQQPRDTGSDGSEEQAEPELTDRDVSDDETFEGESSGGEISAEQRLQRTESLLDEYQDLVYGYAYRLVGNVSVAEDLVQEVYLRAFKSIHNLRRTAAARSWLLTITRNEFSRWCTRKKPATSLETTEEVQELSEEVVVGSDLEQKEWVSVALGKLSDEYRLVIAMYYFEELSYSEIAAQLEIPIGTVMSRLNRAKKHMRDALLQTPDENPR